MATITVNKLGDTPYAGFTTLREAITQANLAAGADTIVFAPGLLGSYITLGGSQLVITDDLTIDGDIDNDGSSDITVSAGYSSRVMDITSKNTNVVIDGLAITGGYTSGNFEGGAGIRAVETTSKLELINSYVYGNATAGIGSDGGGISTFGDLKLTNTLVIGNATGGYDADGGGISTASDLTLIDSVVSGNSTFGDNSEGGGVAATDATLSGSYVAGNTTTGSSSDGGGIYVANDLTLISSTLYANATLGDSATGGGIAAGSADLTSSTLNGNYTYGGGSDGGGIAATKATLTNTTLYGNYTYGSGSDGGGVNATTATLYNSTVSGNYTLGGPSSDGGGIKATTATLNNSLVVGNVTDGTLDEVDVSGTLTNNDSLVGTKDDEATKIFDSYVYVAGTSVYAGKLADNGGDVDTILIAPGGGAHNTGDSANLPAGLLLDARGATFDRVTGTEVDMGAVEIQNVEPQFLSPLDDGEHQVSGLENTLDKTNFGNGFQVFDVNANDGDGGGTDVGITYTLKSGNLDVDGDGKDAFVINQFDGKITIQDEDDLDFEALTDNKFVLKIEANDGQPFNNTATAELTVLLKDEVETFTVTTLVDEDVDTDPPNLARESDTGGLDTGGNYGLSLREAIAVANAGTGSADTIVFDKTLSGDIDLDVALGQLEITADLLIDGDGDDDGSTGAITIDAQGNSRVIKISGTDTDVTIDSLTITGGKTTGDSEGGGAIRANSTLELKNSTVTGNYTTGKDAVGGAIQAEDLTLTNSTVAGNRTEGQYGDGGGIYVGTTATITNSTITGNYTKGTDAEGGGIYSKTAATLTNSLVVGNSAYNATGGGDDAAGTYAYGTDSLVGGDATKIFAQTSTIYGGVEAGDLADNGGPTYTVALKPGDANPAVDPGTTSGAPATDQRGVTRDADPDMGAFEVVSFVVDKIGDVVDGNYAKGETTLREAVNQANASADLSLITFDFGGKDTTIELAGTDLDITEDLVIDGDNLITVDADGLSRVMDVIGKGTDLAIDGLTITGGQTSADNEEGGGIRAATGTTLELIDSTVSGNSTTGKYSSGGGVSADELTLINSTVSGNSTTGDYSYGGGVFAETATLTNSTVSDNGTTGYSGWGGGIYTINNTTLTNTTVSGNSTTGYYAPGGGIVARNYLTLTNSTVSGNSTAGYDSGGGGIYARNNLTLNNSTVSGNSTAGGTGAKSLGSDGGGIVVWATTGGYATFNNSLVVGNVAHYTGFANEDSLVAGTLTNNSSLIGDYAATTFAATAEVLADVDGNGVGEIPTGVYAGVLADNGGGVETIAILGGEGLAHNKGDNSIVPADDQDLDGDGDTGEDIPFDARGTGFDRVIPSTGDVDIGAFEIQNIEPQFEGKLSDGSETISGPENTQDVTNFKNGFEVFDVDANDGDGGGTDVGITYTISKIGNDDVDGDGTAAFAINASTGVITVADEDDLDFEALMGGKFVLEIEASEVAALNNTSTATLTAQLKDVAETFTVTTLDDEVAQTTNLALEASTTLDVVTETGGLSLREAIAIANKGTASDDKIEFDASLTDGTVTLDNTTNGQLAITADLTVDGEDLNITVDANSDQRVLNITGTGTDVTLDSLTLTGGKTTVGGAHGGGIYTESDTTLELVDSTVTGNQTGPTASGADGGGIYAAGALAITRSTVSGNQTGTSGATGGGIHAAGGLTMTNSTVSGNSTTDNSSPGGGIYASDDVILNHSTVSGNSTANATIAGGGIYVNSNADVELNNSLVVGNIAGDGSTSANNDFVQSGTGAYSNIDSLVGDATTLGDYAKDIFRDTDEFGSTGVYYGLLMDNGGPTETIALLGGGLATNAATTSTETIDQRGETRDTAPDIGAFELLAPVAEDDFVGTAPSGAVVIGVLDNDTTSDGAPLDFGDLTAGPGVSVAPTDGLALPTGDGRIVYVADQGTVGLDPFEYEITNSDGTSNADVDVFVVPPPSNPPVQSVVNGSAADETLTGTAVVNILKAAGGDDVLYGLGGSDTLEGGNGNDILIADGASNTLIGDTLGDPSDSGADLFVLTHKSEPAGALTEFQILNDVQIADGDQLLIAIEGLTQADGSIDSDRIGLISVGANSSLVADLDNDLDTDFPFPVPGGEGREAVLAALDGVDSSVDPSAVLAALLLNEIV